MSPCCNLDLENNQQIFLRDTPAHDDASQTKFGNKMFGINLHCDLDLEDSKHFFAHDTLAHNAALQYQVWLQSVLWFRKHHPDKHSLTFESLQ